ncbi:DUF3871 family protein [Flavobacterium ranwuense]|uniref:DUF3871 family protein n=1 Tax=Flavobacterium ranwuense TaxID=2541725 RepID=A0ABY2DV41_9FLAO|nr:DUF3871 family protein [Flavobacterium ranwuense]TDE31578.1 DUF3871 family protein [Flavobacterium ranwuense]
MELVLNSSINEHLVDKNEIINKPSSSFIEANTEIVSLEHLEKDCIIPVFSKDNESTISHFQFVDKCQQIIQKLLPGVLQKTPNIRVSHVVKGRIPSAIGKPAKDLEEHEKTIYYERCAFIIDLPSTKQIVNGNELTLSIGGVRAYNQENLYSKKSMEKFKVFIGFKNKVCTNLCISTDGFSNEIRISSIHELEDKMIELFSNYKRDNHLKMMERMIEYKLSETQFAHLIGKFRMFTHLDKHTQKSIFPISLNDSQINNIVKDYYQCPNFSRSPDGSISFWNLYNLFTEANKSSYIDNNLERNVNAYELINDLGKSIQNNIPNWFLHY